MAFNFGTDPLRRLSGQSFNDNPITGKMADFSPMPEVLSQQLPQTAAQPNAWDKGGKAWRIIGIIGDALQAAGGGRGTYLPAMLDMQQQVEAEKRFQQQLQNQQEIARIRTNAESRPASLKLLDESANWTPDQWARYSALHPQTVMGADGPQLVDPRAMLSALGVGQAPAPQAPAAPAPQSPFTPEQYQGLINGLGPDGAAAYMKRNGFAAPSAPQRSIVRTGTANGRKVVQYSDGTVDYAD